MAVAESTTLSMSFTCDHVSAELASTEQFSIMCRMHTPVYLFTSSRDEAFVKWHYGVSETNYNKSYHYVTMLVGLPWLWAEQCMGPVVAVLIPDTSFRAEMLRHKVS